MTHKVGPKGQVVVPKAIRDRLGIRPGDAVEVDERGGEVRIRRLPRKSRLRGLLPSTGGDALALLEAEHRREIERDRARSA